MKLPNIFKWRLRLVQQGYDLGWKHGYEVGMIEKQHQILEVLTENIESINWLREEPIEVRDIIPIVKSGIKDPEPEETWW